MVTAAKRGNNGLGSERLDDMRLNVDERYFLDHKNELLKNHEGAFVAIRNGELVAHAATRRDMERLLGQKFDGPVYALVKQVTVDAFDFRPDDSILIP